MHQCHQYARQYHTQSDELPMATFQQLNCLNHCKITVTNNGIPLCFAVNYQIYNIDIVFSIIISEGHNSKNVAFRSQISDWYICILQTVCKRIWGSNRRTFFHVCNEIFHFFLYGLLIFFDHRIMCLPFNMLHHFHVNGWEYSVTANYCFIFIFTLWLYDKAGDNRLLCQKRTWVHISMIEKG